MIGRLLRLAGTLLVCACVATVIAQVILLAVLAPRWHLDRQRLVQILAIAYGIEGFGMREEGQQERQLPSSEQASYEQVLERRAVKARDLELRELALRDGLEQLRLAQRKLSDEQKRQKQLKESFDAALRALQDGATASGADEVRRILESIKPKQAKELLTQMLDDEKLDQVVVLMAAMPDAKRAKIIGEFKTPEDTERIGEVLRLIREGVPAAPLANETRKQLVPPKP